MSIEAMKQALAKFEHLWEIGIDAVYKVELLPEIQALRQAIKQTEQKNYQFTYTSYGLRADELDDLSIGELPCKEWVGLTDEEILDLWIANHKDTGATDAFARAIEAKLKEKNT